MEIARLVIPVVSSTIGMVVSLLLVVLLQKQPERDAGTKIGILFGLAVFTMYLSGCGTALSRYYGFAQSNWFNRVSATLSLSIGSFLPVLILFSWRASPVLLWKSSISRVLLVLSCVTSSSVVATLVWLGPARLSVFHLSRIFGANAVLCLMPGAISILRLPLETRLRSFMKVTVSLFIVSSLISVSGAPQIDKTITSSILVSLLLQTCVLIGFLGSFIIVARFRFIDVFVRWSTRVTILGLISIIGTLSFAEAAVKPQFSQKAAEYLACAALELIVLLLLGIVLTEKCEVWIESHVLQRANLKAEAARLYTSLFSIGNKSKLFTFVEDELRKCLEVHQAKILPRTRIPRETISSNSLLDENFGIPERSVLFNIEGLGNIDVLIPIPSNGKIEEVIAISTGAGRRPLHSGEIRFLRELGQQLGVRLHQREIDAVSRRQALREALLRQQLAEAELRALRAQINPHFLFNSLNTIADLIVRNPVNAERMTLRLSSVFRHVLAQSDRQFITIREEFDFLRNYLDIEQERFGENLQVSLELEPPVAHALVPTLLLQPLVENALKHGLGPKGGKRKLHIAAKHSKEGVLLEVIDDGIGFPPNEILAFERGDTHWKSGVGLKNTQERLRSVYGDKSVLIIDSAPMQGCRVAISLPLTEAET